MYVDNDDMAWRVAKCHLQRLHYEISKLLTIDEIEIAFSTL
jgi:hypothetical protein